VPTALLIIWLVSALSTDAIYTPVLAWVGDVELSFTKYAYEVALKESIDPKKFVRLMACESHINPDAAGDFRKETGEYMANGIMQFWKTTFEKFSKQYDLHGDYENPYDQIDLAAKMIADGLWKHWYNCGKVAGYR
jgi:hypothetical protein